jgi:hypothetical protein
LGQLFRFENVFVACSGAHTGLDGRHFTAVTITNIQSKNPYKTNKIELSDILSKNTEKVQAHAQ